MNRPADPQKQPSLDEDPAASTVCLDAAAGPRMMWFDREDARALYIDKRSETLTLCDGRTITVAPDMIADFRDMPFPDETFYHVVFDPPHLERAGEKSWMRAKYGALSPDTWRDDLAAGFAECFRVLRPGGTLIFKWNEYQIPLSEVLALTPEKPLYGHRSGKQSKTHWCAFVKGVEG